jgi:hypothetical protein
MDHTTDTSAPVPDAQLPAPPARVIDVDLPCLYCRYNLRTLTEEAICPECQSPVLWAIHGDMPVSASLSWVRRLWLGVLVVSVCQFALALIMPQLGIRKPAEWMSPTIQVIAVAGFLGAWLLSTNQRDNKAPRQGQVYRVGLRGATIALACLSVMPAEWFAPLYPPNYPPEFIARQNLFAQVLTLWLVFSLCVVYLRRISERIPALSLQIPTWCLLGVMLVQIWLVPALALIAAFAKPGRRPLGPWVWPTLQWSLLVVGVLSAILTFLYSRYLAKALRQRKRRLGEAERI